MTPQEALIELLGRVGAQSGAVLVNADELTRWPAPAVAAMKSQKLLIKTRPAASAVCSGCERECVMPVQTLVRSVGKADLFIVCDKRSDTNRVTVPIDQMTQWRCDADAVSTFIAASLALRMSELRSADSNLIPIGMARGKKRSQMLVLRTVGDLTLVADSNEVPLADLVIFQDGVYSIDAIMIQQMVDASRTADPRHTPNTVKRDASKLNTQAMYASWQKAYQALRKQSPGKSDVWYSQKIAKTDVAQGRDAIPRAVTI